MKTIFLTLSLSLAVLFSSFAVSPLRTRQQVISATEKSLLKVSYQIDETHTYICSGWIIDAAKGWAITAKHCVVDGDGIIVDNLLVNGQPTSVVKASVSLAIVKIPPQSGPPLDLRRSLSLKAEDALAIGYGFGDYVVAQRHVSNPQYGPDPEDVVLDGPLAPGMSGGPIVDMNGQVVGLIQQNSPNFILSLACGADEIRAFLNRKP